MSAFIVPMSHITVLAVFAARHREEIPAIGKLSAKEIGDRLYAENVRSVNYRYEEIDSTKGFELHEGAVFKNLSLMQIAKAASCLNYQSCEHPGWERSEAHSIIQQILAHILTVTQWPTIELMKGCPEYQSAAWEIDLEYGQEVAA